MNQHKQQQTHRRKQKARGPCDHARPAMGEPWGNLWAAEKQTAEINNPKAKNSKHKANKQPATSTKQKATSKKKNRKDKAWGNLRAASGSRGGTLGGCCIIVQ